MDESDGLRSEAQPPESDVEMAEDNVYGQSAAGGSKKGKSTKKPVAQNWFRIGYLVHDVSRMRRTLYDQTLKPLGITRSQWWVLANISRRPHKGIVSSVLARDLDIGKVTLSGLIDRLETAGYVYRRSHRKDKRAKLIYITDAGYALIERMKEVIEPLNRGMCADMSDEEIDATEAGLARIKDNLRHMLGESDESPEEV